MRYIRRIYHCQTDHIVTDAKLFNHSFASHFLETDFNIMGGRKLIKNFKNFLFVGENLFSRNICQRVRRIEQCHSLTDFCIPEAFSYFFCCRRIMGGWNKLMIFQSCFKVFIGLKAKKRSNADFFTVYRIQPWLFHRYVQIT